MSTATIESRWSTPTGVPVVPWRLLRDQLGWQQGEHVTCIGPSGSGKTTLAQQLLRLRDFVAVLGTKPSDPALSALESSGYKRIKRWPPPPSANRVLVWPKIKRREDIEDLRDVFADALDAIYAEGGWTVYVDELLWLKSRLSLGQPIDDLLTQGRALDVSVVTSAQRPFSVPQTALSQATYLALWSASDKRDLDRFGEIGGRVDRTLVRETVQHLPDHAFLWVNTRDGSLAVSRVPLP